MSIKICGHDVRFSNPIKFYTLFKTLTLLMVLNMLVIAPSFAEEARRTTSNTSSVTAMALVMALGLRNVPGPVQRAAKQQPQQNSNLPSAQRQALLLPCDKGCAPARSTTASQPRMAMEK